MGISLLLFNPSKMEITDNFTDEAQMDNFDQEAQSSAPEGELILGKFKSQDELANAYTNLEKAYHTKTPKDEPNETDEDTDAQLAQLDALLQQRGYVKREELQHQELLKREEEQLVAVDPSAQNRLDIVKGLAKTPEFQGKSLVEVDNFVKSKLSSTPPARPNVMGSPQAEPKQPSDMSDDEFMEAYGGTSNRLSKR